MKRPLRKFVSWFLWHGEDIAARAFSRIFWAPAAANGLVIQDEKLLAVDAGEYLMLPGGLLERNETTEEAAVREVREETGLRTRVERKIGESVRGNLGAEHTFLMTVEGGGELSSSWEGKPKWIPLDEIDSYSWRYNRDTRALVDRALEKK
jgi:8-oxo-dGTP pyrophosphatase MutT (NUDIX family)